MEPEGLDSEEEVQAHRRFHIEKVKGLFQSLDLLIFTLGLTESWVHKESGTVYPTAPGTIAGEFDDSIYQFKNAHFSEINEDFRKFQEVLRRIRNGRPAKILLTVSPVPLTATASGNHVLLSTSYSKSVLRAVAGQLVINQRHIDYFPSYEIVTNPRLHSTAFADNLRSVRDESVQNVMRHFFKEHPPIQNAAVSVPVQAGNRKTLEDVQCEEALIEAFAK